MDLLLRHPSASRQKNELKGKINLVDRSLYAYFETPRPEIGLDSSFGYDPKRNWGLWNKEVIEIFFQVRPVAEDVDAPYYEINIDLHGRAFFLKTIKRRETLYTPLYYPFSFKKQRVGKRELWEIKIDLTEKGFVYANLNACMGNLESEREYFGLSLADTPKADFHRPEVFIYLGENK